MALHTDRLAGFARWLALPVWAVGVAGSAKSFRKNPLIGSPALNRRGLHIARVRLAARMTARRRAALAHGLDPVERAAFERDGYVLKHDFLPRPVFEALRDELYGGRFAAREMRQGSAVQRMIALSPAGLAQLPNCRRLYADPRLAALMAYIGSRRGAPVNYVQTVFAQAGDDDPQTVLHSDTFHATAKGWFFVHDVGVDDGPFTYVPGSHRATAARLDWEREQSVRASEDPNGHHAGGSFRVTPALLEQFGYREPVALPVPENTLLLADTFGYHARARSPGPTTRVALYTYARHNPFTPWTGLDPRTLPGLRGRELGLYLAAGDRLAAWRGGQPLWRPVGEVRVDDPPRV
jgi:hypothetical protein